MNLSATETIINEYIKITDNFRKKDIHEIRKEIEKGLRAKKKYIDSKFFYDQTGSQLFEQITALPEYYPTRSEKSILKTMNIDFIGNISELNVVEIGSGDHSKISLFLNNLLSNNHLKVNYIPLDISKTAIKASAENLLKQFPEISIEGIVADFMKQLRCIPKHKHRLFLFLGSTIGNFTPEQADVFLQNLSQVMQPGEYLLLGYDTVKSKEILEKAYNDTAGITARFNKNCLSVLNNLAETNFRIQDFDHIAFFNENENRIEMHLKARRALVIKSPYFSEILTIDKGEQIHTENSYKYTEPVIKAMLKKNKFTHRKTFAHDNDMFHAALIKKT